MSPCKLTTPIMVEFVGGRNVTIRNRLENVTNKLNRNEFHEVLLPFELNEIDVILVMGWLGENLMEILYKRKMVHINPHGEDPFVVYGNKSTIKNGIIMMMKDRKYQTNECTTLLAYVIDTKKVKKGND